VAENLKLGKTCADVQTVSKVEFTLSVTSDSSSLPDEALFTSRVFEGMGGY
jgi:hypothetical protein